MMRYSVHPRDRISVKRYGFVSFAKNMGKNIGKNISKNLSGKCSQKLLDHTKQSATDTLETVPKRAIQKTTEASGDLICNKIVDRIKKVSKISPQKNSETVTNKYYISSEERQKIIDDLRLI